MLQMVVFRGLQAQALEACRVQRRPGSFATNALFHEHQGRGRGSFAKGTSHFPEGFLGSF